MTKTLISSDKQEIIIGFDAPFCVIGERINPTGRKLLAAEMAEGNYDRVISDAVAQVEAGATMLDVNAGIPMADEPAILAESIKLVQDTVDVPLAIDSSIVAALEAGLEGGDDRAVDGKRHIDGVLDQLDRLGEDRRLVGHRDTGIHVQHGGACLDLGDSVGNHAIVIAFCHLGSKQLASRRVDALADDAEGRVKADDDLLLVGRNQCFGH